MTADDNEENKQKKHQQLPAEITGMVIYLG